MNESSFLRFVAFFGVRTRLRSCRTAICPSVKMANLSVGYSSPAGSEPPAMRICPGCGSFVSGKDSSAFSPLFASSSFKISPRRCPPHRTMEPYWFEA